MKLKNPIRTQNQRMVWATIVVSGIAIALSFALGGAVAGWTVIVGILIAVVLLGAALAIAWWIFDGEE